MKGFSTMDPRNVFKICLGLFGKVSVASPASVGCAMATLGVLFTSLTTPGCAGDQPNRQEKERLRNEASQVFSDPAPASGGRNRQDRSSQSDNTSAGGWGVILSRHSGRSAIAEAQQAAESISGRGGLPGVYVASLSDQSAMVVSGRFRSPTEASAQKELARVRGTVVDGSTPYQFAFLGPVARQTDIGALPEFNLAAAREQFGRDAIYTLQIGAYGPLNRVPTPAEREESKRAAEQAVVQLRRDGEVAFYHHGQHMSMVTVGVFGPSDYDPSTPNLQSPRLTSLRDRYPYNLVNGATLLQTIGDQRVPQPSRLVRIPGAR